MKFKDYLTSSAVEIETSLINYLDLWIQKSSHQKPYLDYLFTAFRDACLGGKRVRGTLVKIGYEMTTSERNKDIIFPAIAVEVFQTAILAHDDIIDQSPLRRGKPTIYKILGREHGEHYGISQTICLGDIGLFLGNDMILNSSFETESKLKAMKEFNQMVIDTGIGEIIDVELPYIGGGELEDVDLVNEYKTARYTISVPLLLGAILGGASEEVLQNIRILGSHLGKAFQIKDDILGVFSDEKTIGKSNKSDIEEGKRTLLYWHAVNNLDNDNKLLLQNIYGNGVVSDEEHNKIKQLFIQSGALKKCEDIMKEHSDIAKTLVPKLSDSELYQNRLIDYIENLLQRTH